MSVSIDQGVANTRRILAPVIILALLVLLTFLAVQATQSTADANGVGTVAPTSDSQPDRAGEVFIHREALAMP